ncbi:MAG: dihydropteroate synthase [Acidobacteriota bacterium]
MAIPYRRASFRLRAGDRVLDLGARTLVMGILNVTPDSFSDGGEFLSPQRAAERAWQIAAEGADILDIGGESTRPGSSPVPFEEEQRRVLPVLEALAGRYPIPVSIDTRRPEVARRALELGAVIVNDVTGLQGDSRIAEEAAAHRAGLILVHMRGEPATMQLQPPSDDILREIEAWAGRAVARARSCGVAEDRIVLDPGIGFGKTAEQNLLILRQLERAGAIGFPLLVGTSRKSFIGAVLGSPVPRRAWGTAATVAASIIFGAHIVRVHDVAAMRDVARMTDAIMAEGSGE